MGRRRSMLVSSLCLSLLCVIQGTACSDPNAHTRRPANRPAARASAAVPVGRQSVTQPAARGWELTDIGPASPAAQPIATQPSTDVAIPDYPPIPEGFEVVYVPPASQPSTQRAARDMFDEAADEFAREREELRKAAEAGDAQAQFGLAETFWNERDHTQAVVWYAKAAEQGHAGAQFRLANAYESGWGVSPDLERALALYKQAGEQGHLNAQLALGLLYSLADMDDPAQSAYWYRKAAEQGDASAQGELGGMLAHGRGVRQDYVEAVEWLRKASDQGDQYATHSLGQLYENGQGVAVDLAKAAELYRRAAQRGNDQAMFDVGRMLLTGFGAQADVQEGAKWLELAAGRGNVQAQFLLGSAYYQGEGIPKDSAQAAKWLQKVAEAKAGRFQELRLAARAMLGFLYYRDEGVRADFKQAAAWLQEPADKGNPQAQWMLGLMYSEGQGVPKDIQQAASWYHKAAAQGDAGACGSLAFMYYAGDGVIEDYVEAYKWALLAGRGGQDMSNLKAALAKRMTMDDLAEARQRAKAFLAKMQGENDEKAGPGADRPAPAALSSGTGFFVRSDGYVLTAWHVVDGAQSITLVNGENHWPASVVVSDKANDIAVLKTVAAPPGVLAFAPAVRPAVGSRAFTLGFPNPDLQGMEPKYTEGTISSLTGIQGDPRHYQISTPLQPGNSGGPLLNDAGEVVGLVVSRLSDSATLKITGSLPQNVNYAIKSSLIVPLLDSLPPSPAERATVEPPPAIREATIDHVKAALVLVVCE